MLSQPVHTSRARSTNCPRIANPILLAPCVCRCRCRALTHRRSKLPRLPAGPCAGTRLPLRLPTAAPGAGPVRRTTAGGVPGARGSGRVPWCTSSCRGGCCWGGPSCGGCSGPQCSCHCRVQRPAGCLRRCHSYVPAPTAAAAGSVPVWRRPVWRCPWGRGPGVFRTGCWECASWGRHWGHWYTGCGCCACSPVRCRGCCPVCRPAGTVPRLAGVPVMPLGSGSVLRWRAGPCGWLSLTTGTACHSPLCEGYRSFECLKSEFHPQMTRRTVQLGTEQHQVRLEGSWKRQCSCQQWIRSMTGQPEPEPVSPPEFLALARG